MSPELLLMRSPSQGYAMLLGRTDEVSAVTALRRPLLVAIVIGTAVVLATTGHVSLGLVGSTTLCWSFVVGIQVVAAVGLVLASQRTVSVPRALDLFFVGHAPWSLWLLGFGAWNALAPAIDGDVPALITAAVAGAWTSAIIYGFCRTVGGATTRQALVRTAIHQSFIWGLTFAAAGAAVALWPRIVALVGR